MSYNTFSTDPLWYVDSTLSLMDLYIHSTMTRLQTMLYSPLHMLGYIKILTTPHEYLVDYGNCGKHI